MDTGIKNISVFISCPSDVENEKSIVKSVCKSLSSIYRKTHKIQLTPLDWKENVPSEISNLSPQEIIDKNIQDYDVYIGIFWKRFGDKIVNGLSPTEKEFEDALARKEKIGKPIIKFFFKKKEYSINTVYEADQIKEIQIFKERIKKIGIYDEFFDDISFQDIVYKSLLYILLNYGELTTVKQLDIIKEETPFLYYIQRKVVPQNSYFERDAFLFGFHDSSDIIPIIKQKKKIVLLSGAGNGKTTELKRIENHFSKNDKKLYPIFISLNVYVDQDFNKFIPEEYNNLPKNNYLFILDGLDELPSEQKNIAIRKFEFFCNEYSDSHFIISSRFNFFISETKSTPGTLSDFESYVLTELEGEQIEAYIKEKLKVKESAFNNVIFRQNLQDILKIPFYLIKIVNIFLEESKLPNNKSELFEKIIELTFIQDKFKFKNTQDISGKQNIIRRALEKIAISMELLGKYYLGDDELNIILDEKEFNIIRYSSIVKYDNSRNLLFEHKNFQEYLCANIIANKSFAQIKSFLFFSPKYKKIIPSRINILSYIFSILDKGSPVFNKLLDWLMRNCKDKLIDLEKERIDLSSRISIFKEIINKYTQLGILVNRDKYNYRKLAEFADSKDVFKYLLKMIKSKKNTQIIILSIELISFLHLYNELISEAKRIFKKLLKNKNKHIVYYTLRTVKDLNLFNKEEVEETISLLEKSEEDYIRAGIYYLLVNTELLEEYIDIFLKGIQYQRHELHQNYDETRIGDEYYYLITGLKQISTVNAIKKFLKHFTNNPDLFIDFYFNDFNVIFNTAIKLYGEDSDIMYYVADFAMAKCKKLHHNSDIKYILEFFKKTDTKTKAFKYIIEKRMEMYYISDILSHLFESNLIEYIIDEYKNQSLKDNDIYYFLGNLKSINEELYNQLLEKLNNATNNKFIPSPINTRDYEKEREEAFKYYINVLFDKDKFFEIMKSVFDLIGKDEINSNDIMKTHSILDEDNYKLFHFYSLLRKTVRDISITFNSFCDLQIFLNWDYFYINEIYEYWRNGWKINLSENQKSIIEKFIIAKLNNSSFMEIKNSDRGLATWICFYTRKLNIVIPEQTLLEMLSYDTIDTNEWIGIDYLEERLEPDKIKNKIIKNIRDKTVNGQPLINQLNYCLKNKILDVIEYLPHYLINLSLKDLARYKALEVVFELTENNDLLESILKEIKDEFRWYVVDKLFKRQSKILKEYLLKILNNEDGIDKLKASIYLIKIQEPVGFKYYIEETKKLKHIPYVNDYSLDYFPIPFVYIVSALKYLLELLNVTYKKDFIEDDFHRLRNELIHTITNIALQNKRNFNLVIKSLKDFIRRNKNKNKEIKYLHRTIENIEISFDIYSIKKYDINSVKTELKKYFKH
jgi:hypothetical protein